MPRAFHTGYLFRTCQRCYNIGHCKASATNSCETLKRVYVCLTCKHRWHTVEIRVDSYNADPSIVPIAMTTAFKLSFKYKGYDLSLIPIGDYMTIPYDMCKRSGLESKQTKINKTGLMRIRLRYMTTGIRVHRDA
jgi:hypothetical protein